MNLFLVGWSPSGQVDCSLAEEVVAGVLEELPFFDNEALRVWSAPSGRVVALSVAHGGARTGGVAYSYFEKDRFAMYSGRPFFWSGEFETDGRRMLDPRSFLQPVEGGSISLTDDVPRSATKTRLRRWMSTGTRSARTTFMRPMSRETTGSATA